MRASLSTWRLLDGTAAEDIDRAVAHRLASFPPKGLVGAFAVQTGSDAVTVVVVAGGATDDALDGLAEKLAGRAEPIAEKVGPAQDLLALADDGRRALAYPQRSVQASAAAIIMLTAPVRLRHSSYPFPAPARFSSPNSPDYRR